MQSGFQLERNVIADSPCGSLVPTINGQQAFVPDALPRQIDLGLDLVRQLVDATDAVGRLAGVGETIQNPRLLIAPFLRREAVLSSRIEGTEASLSDVFQYEATGKQDPSRLRPGDVAEVVNYVRALEYGLDRVNQLPISVRLLNEVHAILLEDVRGGDRRPGELRTTQVWTGSAGTPIEDARYIPPPSNLLRDLLFDWELFVNNSSQLPPLIQCALMHYQIEAIHPYLDGNGRIGRLLIGLFLCEKRILPTPLLYLSAYFERARQRYYDELFRVSLTGDWEAWLLYFLEGVAEQARDALNRARTVRTLHDQYRQLLQERRDTGNGFRLLDGLFDSPIMTVSLATRLLEVSTAGARGVLDRLVDAGILTYDTNSWPRLYFASDLIAAIEAPQSR
ncbi:MAG TPA: cell filamentation protein Fic [Dehalococcoidia bacterium]|nr:cell filamentation protein Fic [Dehalococcoidia bacterium]